VNSWYSMYYKFRPKVQLGPAGARRYRYLPTFILRGLTRLNLEFTPAAEQPR
jgi:hypothetical protein